MINLLEEVARSNDVVLQWRINKIASWMSLKSSEINNCSWIISTVLESVLVSSSSCHAFLPLAVRPVMTTREMFLKILFNSPELNCSVIFSKYLFVMTKKMNQFLRHIIIGDWIFSWFNISPISFSNRYGSCGWAGRISSLWFCFGLWSARKSTCVQF